jgi:hypothetical protein
VKLVCLAGINGLDQIIIFIFDLFGIQIFFAVIVACHLTRIFQSGGNSQFRQNIDLEQDPDADNSQHDE